MDKEGIANLNFINQIICGDCVEVLSTFPDECIDLILTDPPYGLNNKKIIGDNDLTIWKRSLNPSYKALKNDSFYLCFTPTKKLPEMLLELQKRFTYRWQIIFYINNGMVHGSMGFSTYCSCLVFTKGKAKIKKQIRDVYETSTSSKEMKLRVHPYQKDLKFISTLINSCSAVGDLVLDPFVGSGTTCVAAKSLGRNYLGIDISAEYCELARKRIMNG
jgi:site-specific DNA-methyltransferase (adenine-specific)